MTLARFNVQPFSAQSGIAANTTSKRDTQKKEKENLLLDTRYAADVAVAAAAAAASGRLTFKIRLKAVQTAHISSSQSDRRLPFGPTIQQSR